MSEINQALHQRAVGEITRILTDSHNEVQGLPDIDRSKAFVLRQQAEHCLKERLSILFTMNGEFETHLAKARTKKHKGSLRTGHRENMQRILTGLHPKVQEVTANEILDELFGPV